MSQKPSNRKYVFEVISNSGKTPEIIGHVWWTGKTIESDVPSVLKELKGIYIADKKFSDGLDFFTLLPLHFRSGYITVKKAK